MKVKPSKAVNKNPTDAVSWQQLPKLRAGTGSQSACAMAASPWEKEQEKTAKNDFLHPSQQTVLGHYRPVSETPFEWRFACGPIVASF